LLSTALDAGAAVEAVYVAPGGRAAAAAVRAVERAHTFGARVFDLAPGVIERVAGTVTPQPVLAVVGYEPATLADLGAASMVMVCVDIRDPGNAGTMIRTADAAGLDAVVCCDGTVDPTNPKTVRASAGSLFHVPVVSGGEAGELLRGLRGSGFVTIGAVVRGGSDYCAVDWRGPVALVFGNESSGLGPAVEGLLDEQVSIPMDGRAESLNVGSAAAVLCFEARRQRGPAPARSGGRVAVPPDRARPGSTMQAVPKPPTGEGSPSTAVST
jgi:TrmH family RNA methyltransferase